MFCVKILILLAAALFFTPSTNNARKTDDLVDSSTKIKPGPPVPPRGKIYVANKGKPPKIKLIGLKSSTTDAGTRKDSALKDNAYPTTKALPLPFNLASVNAWPTTQAAPLRSYASKGLKFFTTDAGTRKDSALKDNAYPTTKALPLPFNLARVNAWPTTQAAPLRLYAPIGLKSSTTDAGTRKDSALNDNAYPTTKALPLPFNLARVNAWPTTQAAPLRLYAPIGLKSSTTDAGTRKDSALNDNAYPTTKALPLPFNLASVNAWPITKAAPLRLYAPKGLKSSTTDAGTRKDFALKDNAYPTTKAPPLPFKLANGIPGIPRLSRKTKREAHIPKVPLPTTIYFSPERASYVINLGVLFSQQAVAEMEAFQIMLQRFKTSNLTRNTQVNVLYDTINTSDMFKIARLICRKLGSGMLFMVGSVTTDAFARLKWYTNRFNLPFLLPQFPAHMVNLEVQRNSAVSLRGSYHQAVIDVLKQLRWNEIIYFNEVDSSNMETDLVNNIVQPDLDKISITHMLQVRSSKEVIDFLSLIQANNKNQFNRTRVVLDCGTEMAREVLVKHARHINLGRENYDYFMAGLVMDDLLLKKEEEFGLINCYGFQVLDYTRPFVRNFMKTWPHNYINAKAALMVDAMTLLEHSIHAITNPYSEFLRTYSNETAKNSEPDYCLGEKKVYESEYGEAISNLIQGTEFEGLTGNIQFPDTSVRNNFTLYISQLNTNGTPVKIGTWSDIGGLGFFQPIKESAEKLKELFVAIVYEFPFFMKYFDNFNADGAHKIRGLCMDILDRISKSTGIVFRMFEIQEEDLKFMNQAGSWDGKIGDKKFDLVVGALRVTEERKSIVQFTNPFISYVKMQNTNYWFTQPLVFIKLFGLPLTIATTVGMIAASLTLKLISIMENKCMGAESQRGNADQSNGENQETLSFGMALWIAISVFCRQHVRFYRSRFISTKIVLCSWGLFCTFVALEYLLTVFCWMVDNKHLQTAYECPKDLGLAIKSLFEDGDHPQESNMYMSSSNKESEEEGCKPLLSNSVPGDIDFSFALPKASKLGELFNRELKKLEDSGELRRLKTYWFQNSWQPTPSPRSYFGTSHFTGMLICLGIALSFSLAVGLFTVLLRKYRSKRTNNAADN